jgi:hypothetical protein
VRRMRCSPFGGCIAFLLFGWEVAIKAGRAQLLVKASFGAAVADYGFEEPPVQFEHEPRC